MKLLFKLIFVISITGIFRTPILSQELTYDYYGQTPPGDNPVIFAPGIVSINNKNSHALVVSPDGNMIIFSRYPDGTSYILSKENDIWTGPSVSFFYGKEVSFSPDGKRIFYYTGGDIFYVEKNSTGWNQPVKLGTNVNSSGLVEYYPSIVNNGDLYFSRDGNWASGRLMNSKYVNGTFQKATDLGLPINNGGALHAWFSPDESYVLFNSLRSGSYTDLDIWISFKKSDSTWSNPQNLGTKINSGADAILCPTVSPDGKYLFFTKMNFSTNTGYIYWVNTKIIDSLKAIMNSTLINYNETLLNSYQLIQNYPNPFNPTTTISYSIPSSSLVSLKVYDVLGDMVANLVNEYKDIGSYKVSFNASSIEGGLSSGVYFYQLICDNYIATKKLLLLK
ncbi:MAG: T9SS type A sorting domain-containing protein [bacterium]